MKRNSAILILAILLASCSPNSRILNSAQKQDQAAPAGPAKSDFERDVESMQTANFQYIFVLRRKDGGKLDKDDKDFVRANKTPEINRVILSDDDKALIAGSNYPFPPEKLKPLQERFNFEDLSSKPANDTAPKNVNAK